MNILPDAIKEEFTMGSFDYQSKHCPHGMQGRHERCVSCLMHYGATAIHTERSYLMNKEAVIRAQAANLGELRRELDLATARVKELETTHGQS